MAFDLTKPSMSDADWPTFAANIRENIRAIVEGDAGVYTTANDITLQITTTGTTKFSRVATRSGNGTTSARKSYFRAETLETTPQAWHAGMLGDKNFGIRDETAAVTRVIIDQATGRVSIGGASMFNALDVFDSQNIYTFHSAIGLYEATSLAAGNGGGIAFGGKYTAGGSYTAWAGIQAPKNNATDGDYAGGLAFWTRANGVAAALCLTLTAAGSVVIGTGALATNATNGFLYIDSCAGTPTGVPVANTGRVAVIYDTTNNKLYAYNGAWKSVTLT
jgi:hypothetical protein